MSTRTLDSGRIPRGFGSRDRLPFWSGGLSSILNVVLAGCKAVRIVPAVKFLRRDPFIFQIDPLYNHIYREPFAKRVLGLQARSLANVPGRVGAARGECSPHLYAHNVTWATSRDEALI